MNAGTPFICFLRSTTCHDGPWPQAVCEKQPFLHLVFFQCVFGNSDEKGS